MLGVTVLVHAEIIPPPPCLLLHCVSSHNSTVQMPCIQVSCLTKQRIWSSRKTNSATCTHIIKQWHQDMNVIFKRYKNNFFYEQAQPSAHQTLILTWAIKIHIFFKRPWHFLFIIYRQTDFLHKLTQQWKSGKIIINILTSDNLKIMWLQGSWKYFFCINFMSGVFFLSKTCCVKSFITGLSTINRSCFDWHVHDCDEHSVE